MLDIKIQPHIYKDWMDCKIVSAYHKRVNSEFFLTFSEFENLEYFLERYFYRKSETRLQQHKCSKDWDVAFKDWI